MDEKMHRILVPFDGSEPSLRALDFAMSLCLGRPVILDVVTVVDLHMVTPFDGFGLSKSEFSTYRQQVREELLGLAEKRLKGRCHGSRFRVLQGPVLRILYEETEQDDVVQVVVGRTGKGLFERLVAGSISRGLVAHSAKPVTVVP